VEASTVITPGEDEVILSDRLIDALGIVLLRPGEGIWRLADEEGSSGGGSNRKGGTPG